METEIYGRETAMRTILRAVNGLLILATLTIGVGCSSMPLSTMWRMRDFGIEDLQKIDPNDLRVQIVLPGPMSEKLKTAEVNVINTRAKGQVDKYRFPAEIIERKELREGWRKLRVLGETTWKLTGEGVADFVRMQKTLADPSQEYRHTEINVKADGDPEPGLEPKPFEITIRLRLRADEPYLTLIEKAKITPEVKKPEAAAEKK
jgi:hypothetical protein